MTTTFLLGPTEFTDRSSHDGLALRRRLAQCLAVGRRVVIMEDAATLPDEPLADKFIRLLDGSDEVVVWLPHGARLPTVFSELVALRFRPQAHHVKVVIFHEGDVLESDADEFLVREPSGRIAYLRDLRNIVEVRTWRYEGLADLEELLMNHALGTLDPKR